MKRLSFKIFSFILFTNFLLAQETNWCDSLKKCNEKKPNLNSRCVQKTADINISIDNSKIEAFPLNQKTNTIVTKYVCECNSARKAEENEPSLLRKSIEKLIENSFSIAAVLLAGLLALYQVKSNTIASSRINWNDSLKKSLSQYYTETLNTAFYRNEFIETNTKAKGSETIKNEIYRKYLESLSQYNALSNILRMQLNSNESEHNRIEIILDKIDRIIDGEPEKLIDLNSLELDLREIVALSKIIFKREWEKSKSMFRI